MDNWTHSTLDSIAKVTMGSSPSSKAYNNEMEGLPLVQGNADIKNRITKPRVYTSEITKECQINDIIMTVRAPVGAIAKANINACIGRGVCAIHPLKIDPEYLYQFLIAAEDRWGALEQGSTFTAVNSKEVKQLKIKYPIMLSEQQKIAKILSTVDEKIDLVDQKIKQTELLKMGMMQKLFSEGVGVLDENDNWNPHTEFQGSPTNKIPECWNKYHLGDIASVERGKFSARPRNDPKYFGGDIPFVQTGDVVNSTRFIDKFSQTLNEEGLTVSRIFPVGTILITIAANIGDVAITKFPLACPDSLVGIQPIKELCDTTWLFYFLKTQKSELDLKATKSAQKNINLQVLKPLNVYLPSIDEQQYIAKILTTLDEKIELLQQQKSENQKLKKGLMQKLLTGGWRVSLDDNEAA